MIVIVDNLCKDPFRLCFPVAFALAVFASMQGISFAVFGNGFYPGRSHAQLFVGGFLYLSIQGFLMTAIPHFTQTEFASPKELISLIVTVAGVVSTIIFDQQAISIGW